jgi:hypothetical protein
MLQNLEFCGLNISNSSTFHRENKAGNARRTQHWGTFVQPLWQCRSNKYIFWVFTSSLRYPAYDAYAPYCHLWPVRLYWIFPHYLIKGTIYGGKNLLNVKCVFWFSLQLLSVTFPILIRAERDTIINVHRHSCKVPCCFIAKFSITHNSVFCECLLSDSYLQISFIAHYLLTYLLTHSLTHSLTPWSRVLLERLTGLQLVKKFPAFYGTRKFITAFTSARYLSLSLASSIQPTPPHRTSWRSALLLSSNLRLGLLSHLFPSGL